MGNVKKFALTAVIAGVSMLAGCGGGVYYAGVTVGPAPLVYGPVGIAPGPGYIWTDGFYNWRGGA